MFSKFYDFASQDDDDDDADDDNDNDDNDDDNDNDDLMIVRRRSMAMIKTAPPMKKEFQSIAHDVR